MINYSDIELYDEDEAVNLQLKLEDLKNKVIVDNDNNFYVFKDFYFESVTYLTGVFKKKEVTKFYIKWMEIDSIKSGETIIHEKNHLCCIDGVRLLHEYYKNWWELQLNLNKLDEHLELAN